MKAFSSEQRSENIEKFSQQEYDLAIIGGGITGAGVARDAASRGMKVALIERNDFAFGTSSRSSKLVHGGIRYLENLEFGLVFEALSERRLLFEIAPHLVHPLRFTLPLYESGRVGMFKMGLGMWLYDALSLFEAPEMHERLSPQKTLSRIGTLQPDELIGSYVYSDAYMDDDRLVHETLRSANDFGARCANYVEALGADFDTDGSVTGLKCKDLLSGSSFGIKAKHTISTVGPWTDELGSSILGEWKKIMRPSKGIHLTLSRERLPLSSAVVMAADKDKRIIFAIPRHEMVIIGTTDTDFSGDLNDVHANSADVEYLLKIVSEYFPGANLKREDIIASYAGVRPLVHDGSDSESSTSREHLIYSDPRNVTFVAGGKYTTYRHMAEQTVETALANFSREEQVEYYHSKTKTPLNPDVDIDSFAQAQTKVDEWSHEFKLPQASVQKLVDRHGLEARKLLSIVSNFDSENEDTKVWLAEAAHAIENTMCLNLIDFYLRRAPLFLAEKDHGLAHLEALSNLFAKHYMWDDSVKSAEVQKVHQHVQKELSWKY